MIDIEDNYIEEKFDEYLFSDPLKLDFIQHSQEFPYKFWQKVYSYDEDWEKFVDHALRFCSSFATETIVEHLLSIQKHIQNNQMTNVSKEIVKARMRLHQPTTQQKQ